MANIWCVDISYGVQGEECPGLQCQEAMGARGLDIPARLWSLQLLLYK